MALKQLGRYWGFPIVGHRIHKIIYPGMITLVFDDPVGCMFDLHGDLVVTRHHFTERFDPRSAEALILCHELMGKEVIAAKADREGNLWLTWEGPIEVMIEDGTYEHWHFTEPGKSANSVHGGMGRTVLWKGAEFK
jgi:Family of unknown function (DUF6188)